MLVGLRNFSQVQSNNYSQAKNNAQYFNNRTSVGDTVHFTGMSKPSQYKNIFEFLAAKVLSTKKKIISEDELSATNIKKGVETVFNPETIYGPYTKAKHSEIKWQAYVPEDVKQFSVDKINDARVERLSKWKNVLEGSEKEFDEQIPDTLKKKLNDNKSLRIVIWNAVNSEIKTNNRHIPVPFNAKALEQTIKGFEAIAPLDRKVRCKDISFIEMYTHRLRDNILMEKGVSDEAKSVWVRIPSIKHDPKNKAKNISDVETLSYRNWCTRSSVDKAEDVLKDGDFYIYLERGKNDMWQPLIGMASFEDKISQIQGADNNNIIPLKQLPKVKEFIKSKKLKCQSGIVDEGPRANQQILISEKLSEQRPNLEKSFEKALKTDDIPMVFEYLDKPMKVLDNGTYEIKGYKPTYLADKNKGITLPLNMMGVNEDKLLENVSVVRGDLILDNKDVLLNSHITKIPEKLEKVTGKISCNRAQYEQFGDRLQQIAQNPKAITVHEWQ